MRHRQLGSTLAEIHQHMNSSLTIKASEPADSEESHFPGDKSSNLEPINISFRYASELAGVVDGCCFLAYPFGNEADHCCNEEPSY